MRFPYVMRYTIQYFKNEKLLGESHWIGTPKAVQQVAKDGLVVFNADAARIFDSDGSEIAKLKKVARTRPRDSDVGQQPEN
jgi:hypothetical protein